MGHAPLLTQRLAELQPFLKQRAHDRLITLKRKEYPSQEQERPGNTPLVTYRSKEREPFLDQGTSLAVLALTASQQCQVAERFCNVVLVAHLTPECQGILHQRASCDRSAVIPGYRPQQKERERDASCIFE